MLVGDVPSGCAEARLVRGERRARFAAGANESDLVLSLEGREGELLEVKLSRSFWNLRFEVSRATGIAKGPERIDPGG